MNQEGLKRILKYAILHNAMSRSVEQVLNAFQEGCIMSEVDIEILNNEDDLPF